MSSRALGVLLLIINKIADKDTSSMDGASEKIINVLFLVHTLARGGAETQLITLINKINAKRFNKSLIIFDKNIDQLSCVDTDTVKTHHFYRKFKYDYRIIKRIAKYIDDNQIEVIHCTLQFSVLIGQLAVILARRNPRIIAALHTTVNVNTKYELFDKYCYRYLLRKCEKIIFVCKEQEEYWTQRFPELKEASVVIYNGVDVDHFCVDNLQVTRTELKYDLPHSKDAHIISCIAGFRPEKGHRYLINAFVRMNKDCQLILVGDGPTRKDIEMLVHDKGVSNRVQFVGEIDDVRPILRISDITVIASNSVETFSMAMLESMSMQTPVVASNVGGLSEAIIPGDTGILTEPANPEELADKITKILSNKQELIDMGRNARRIVIEKFSDIKMVKETERILFESAQ